MAKLRPKQERFCQEYIIDLNVTQAAIRAGYNKNSAGIIGDENLKKLKSKNASLNFSKSAISVQKLMRITCFVGRGRLV
ncbi:terminase small subunit [Enterobacter mori]|uniref:terminase small subunit n=1 Tax=Enterobacter mori TaxID=539813 RepID=UPI002ED3D22E|nr:terminase small subunit [Enterobacter mori]